MMVIYKVSDAIRESFDTGNSIGNVSKCVFHLVGDNFGITHLLAKQLVDYLVGRQDLKSQSG